MAQKFILDSSGKCKDCDLSPPRGEVISCSTCKNHYHALCSKSGDNDFICRMSFLKLWHLPSVKDNFEWHCDNCKTKREEIAASTIEDRFEKLVTLVTELKTEMRSELNTVKGSIADIANSNSSAVTQNAVVDISDSHTGMQPGNRWNNQETVKKIKSSLVMKNKEGSTTDKDAEIAKLKEIAVKNRIPVTRVGFDVNGNTFVDCPSQSDCDRLQPILSSDFQEKEVTSLKNKLPCISVVGIQDEVTKTNFVNLVCKQNPRIDTLVSAGEVFTVLFVKSINDEYNVVARVSPKIRKVIYLERNRVFLGITSCRVYDRFHVKRCNNCQEYGHYQSDCSKPPCCAHCSLPHRSDKCESKDTLKCINCAKENLEHASGHAAFSLKCPTYIAAQNRLRSTVPYYQSFRKNNRSNLNN